MVLFWVFCGILQLLLTQTVVVDEAAVQRAVREALAESGGSADLSGAPDIVLATTQNPLVAHAQGQGQESQAQEQESHPPSYQNGTDVVMLESPVHNPLSTSLLGNATSPITLLPQPQPQSQSQTASVIEGTSALRVSVAARAHRTYDVIP